jgi:hypothetical protein
VGGELALRITAMDSAENEVGRAVVVPPSARALPNDTALIGVVSNDPASVGYTLEAIEKATRQALVVANSRVLVTAPEILEQADRCGMLDAQVIDEYGNGHPLRSADVTWFGGKAYVEGVLPGGIAETVQPQAHKLFDAHVWPAADRQKLWHGLVLMVLAVISVGFLTPRRRWFLATACMLAVAAGTTAIVLQFGDVRMSRLSEARVVYVGAKRGTETFTLLESRGGKTAQLNYLAYPQPNDLVYADPVLASSEDLFRHQCTLTYPEDMVLPNSWGDDSVPTRKLCFTYETSRPLLLLHKVTTLVQSPIDMSGPTAVKAGFGLLESRPNFIAALYVEGTSATNHKNRMQPVEAWAVEWARSADPEIAYAGRSLKWWADTRQEGDQPYILVWVHEQPPEKTDDGQEHRWMPAMVVYTERP